MVTAGAKLTKKYAYESLADYVNQKCGTSWTYENAEARLKAYLKLYKEISRVYRNPGEEKYCLGQSDFSKGITTLDQKLEKDCPMFLRMNCLFGGKQNIIPSYVMQSGLALSDRQPVPMGEEATSDSEEGAEEDADMQERGRDNSSEEQLYEQQYENTPTDAFYPLEGAVLQHSQSSSSSQSQSKSQS